MWGFQDVFNVFFYVFLLVFHSVSISFSMLFQPCSLQVGCWISVHPRLPPWSMASRRPPSTGRGRWILGAASLDRPHMACTWHAHGMHMACTWHGMGIWERLTKREKLLEICLKRGFVCWFLGGLAGSQAFLNFGCWDCLLDITWLNRQHMGRSGPGSWWMIASARSGVLLATFDHTMPGYMFACSKRRVKKVKRM